MNENKLSDILYNAIGEIVKMEDVDYCGDDVEMAHICADDILINVIKSISDATDDETVKNYADELVNKYSAVPKWYA